MYIAKYFTLFSQKERLIISINSAVAVCLHVYISLKFGDVCDHFETQEASSIFAGKCKNV
jgi:hypothetical protein